MHLHHEVSKCSLYVCSRVQGSQIFKRNSIISICSKVIAFLVISLSPWSPHCPHIVSMLSPHCPHHLHVIPIVFIILTSSIWSPHYPHPHIFTPPTPTLPRGGTPRISKNSIRFELIEIFKFCLKI